MPHAISLVVRMKLQLLAILLFYGSRFSLSGNSDGMESVPDLLKSMYNTLEGFPCVRLLNLSGEIGCGNPGRSSVASPVVRFSSNKDLTRYSAILVSMDEFQLLLGRISNESDYAKFVSGVIVESGDETSITRKGFSPDKKFPGAEFAPYQNKDYEWNPIGSGISWRFYNFPIFLLSNDSTKYIQEANLFAISSYILLTAIVLVIFLCVCIFKFFIILFQIAMRDEKQLTSYTYNVVEFNSVMQTTKSGTRNTESCLSEDTCLPLGGYSVWSSLPPINVTSPISKPIILVVASMDSSSFFRDKGQGAESPVSGLISLLAVVESLSHLKSLKDLSKQFVFAVFTGEAWGFLGSRRFIHELDLHSDDVLGLDYSQIYMIVEIGSVGRAMNTGNTTFFAHTSGVSSAINEAWNALKDARDSLPVDINLSLASASNPGVPPSSLISFVRKNSSTTGILLEDFDTMFSNKYYMSQFDDKSNINITSITAAASLAARTLYLLASGGNPSTSTLNAIAANASLIEELASCLLHCNPGFSCELVKRYISPSTACPSHYVGVITGEPSTSAGVINDVSRFIWNFLADVTSAPRENPPADCALGCNAKDHACIKLEIDGKGECVASTTRYVPAYSTRLRFESGIWSVMKAEGSDPMGEVDPVWTESNWDTIGIRVYKVQNAAFDRMVLLIGVAVTVLAYVIIVSARTTYSKIAKWD